MTSVNFPWMFEEDRIKIDAWAWENCASYQGWSPRWSDSLGMQFVFLDENDSTYFKMVWG